jgi:8-oxo-dGTP diphosphatase
VSDSEPEVRAAGGIILRDGEDGAEVVAVHRPKWDDWSLPKGKLEEGESWEEAALREVEEETGLRCELGEELASVSYTDHKGRPKRVRWWLMTSLSSGPDPVSEDEVDEVRWVPVGEADRLLDYAGDRERLREALSRRRSG